MDRNGPNLYVFMTGWFVVILKHSFEALLGGWFWSVYWGCFHYYLYENTLPLSKRLRAFSMTTIFANN